MRHPSVVGDLRAGPDEVSLLRDAHWLGERGTDLSPVGPDLDVALGLEAAGFLVLSVTGRILGKPCYRVAPEHRAIAEECHGVVEAERDELRQRIRAAVAAAAPGQSVPARLAPC